MRQLLVLVALLLIAPRSAGATAQRPEEILVNGRLLALYATPLDALVSGREDLKKVFEWPHTALWRGYVGRWAVEGERLYLVGLEQEIYEGKGAGSKGPFRIPYPLSTVFGGHVESPVPATWFTGVLRVPLGGPRRYVHMGFGTTFAREIHLHVVRGVVTFEEQIDGIHGARGRSRTDLVWCSLPSAGGGTRPLPPSDGWIDARGIVAGAPVDRVPRGTVLRTRGVLDREDDARWTLWIPQTLVTPDVVVDLRGIDALRMDKTWPHVEIEAVWPADQEKPLLDVRWVRPLEPGETIHDPAFPLPDELLPDLGEDEPEEEPPLLLKSARQVLAKWDHSERITLTGPLEVATDGTTTLLGVDVAADTAHKGQAVAATGRIARYEISERLLKVQHPDLAPFRARGPGTYFRLLDPAHDKLVIAKPGSAPR
jgi:hypothetical protein